MKGIVFTEDEAMFVKELEQPTWESLQKVVGGYFEVVHPRGLQHPFCFVCNEEGLLRNLPINLIGSLWYGTMEHGCPIVGDIIVLKEGMTDDEPDIVGLEENDIREIKAKAAALSGGRIRDLDAVEGDPSSVTADAVPPSPRGKALGAGPGRTGSGV